MHALTQSLAHRGPGASRARSRWQPYSSTITSSATPSRSPTTYLSTPASSISSSPPSAAVVASICNIDRPRKPPAHALNPSTTQLQFRALQKHKYASRLVDQAVTSLCDIWRPDDIPEAFRTSCTGLAASFAGEPDATPQFTSPSQLSSFHTHNRQLPSPISPSTRHSPISPQLPIGSQSSSEGSPMDSHLIPIKGFVHEVLRRSRTSTGVLQTALCYLEAIRLKIPGVLRHERTSGQSAAEEDLSSRIVIGDLSDCLESSLSSDHELPSLYDCPPSASETSFDTIHADAQMQGPPTAPSTEYLPSCAFFPTAPAAAPAAASKRPSPTLPPLPPLPSPLLCPRRTFLACLVLASKFMQDRSYSNRAWAKLAGLPPREIGRCERALGDALEWRLWVGKGPSPGASGAAASRAVTRCRSESNITFSEGTAVSTSTARASAHGAAAGSCRVSLGLTRSATVPNIGSHRACDLAGSTSALADDEIAMEDCEGAAMPLGRTSSVGPSYFAVAPQREASRPDLSVSGDDFSPLDLTPTLTYSPMSTASSASSDDGDRTVQMSTFLDLPTPVPAYPPFLSKSHLAGASVRMVEGDGVLDGVDYGAVGQSLTIVEPSAMYAQGHPYPQFSETSINPLASAMGAPNTDSMYYWTMNTDLS